jgi:hypothetical protein
MKKLLITAASLLTCVWAFGQGSVSFDLSDYNHCIYFTSDTTQLKAADANLVVGGFALAGSGAYTGDGSTIAAVSGPTTWTAALYGGPNAGSLTLQTTTTIGDYGFEGNVDQVPCYPSGIAGGTTWTWEVQVYQGITPALGSALSAGAATAWADGYYAGISSTFTCILNGSANVSIWDPTAAPGGASTWANGTWDLIDDAGNYGAIPITAVVPEPGTFALAGLGLAALLVFRRRN